MSMRWILIFTLAASAVAVSAVAAYFSIIGLAQLFAAAMLPVIIMGIVLENAKVITTAWLHVFWGRAPWTLKGPLTAMVIALMLVTSLGIFGFLSAGHLEQTAPADAKRLSIERVDTQIAQREAAITRAEQTLGLLDKSIDVFLKNDRATQGLDARRRQQAERQAIQTQLREERAELDRLQQERLTLRQGLGTVEAKLGPIKYLAKALGVSADADVAVLVVIAVLMFAFDPLAILLVIATVITVQGLLSRPAAKAPQSPPERPRGPLGSILHPPRPEPIPAAPAPVDEPDESELDDPSPAMPEASIMRPLVPDAVELHIKDVIPLPGNEEAVAPIPADPPRTAPIHSPAPVESGPINPPVDETFQELCVPQPTRLDAGRGRWRK